MTMYCLIDRDLTTVLKKRKDVSVVPKANLAPGKPYWVPLVEVEDDRSSGRDVCVDSITDIILEDRVERVTVIRDRTDKEIESDKDIRAEEQVRAFGRVILAEINTIREALGLKPRTLDQLKDAVRAEL